MAELRPARQVPGQTVLPLLRQGRRRLHRPRPQWGVDQKAVPPLQTRMGQGWQFSNIKKGPENLRTFFIIYTVCPIELEMKFPL